LSSGMINKNYLTINKNLDVSQNSLYLK